VLLVHAFHNPTLAHVCVLLPQVRRLFRLATNNKAFRRLVLEDERLLAPARAFLGSDDLVLMQSMALLKPPGTGEKRFHQDQGQKEGLATNMRLTFSFNFAVVMQMLSCQLVPHTHTHTHARARKRTHTHTDSLTAHDLPKVCFGSRTTAWGRAAFSDGGLPSTLPIKATGAWYLHQGLSTTASCITRCLFLRRQQHTSTTLSPTPHAQKTRSLYVVPLLV
jgi:hypothetical protein